MPPIPSPSDDDTGVRRGPVRAQPFNLSRNRAPHHAAGMNLAAPQKPTPAPVGLPGEAATPRRKAKVATSATAAPAEGAKAIGQSVLRRTSFEAEASAEPARLSLPAAEPISNERWEDDSVPVNPLR
jgi:hypothetical protein